MEQKTKILVIEDQPIVQWGLSIIIEQKMKNTTFHLPPTFDQGLAYLRQNTSDMVVLDIDVPGGNSPAMIHQLREISPQLPILIYSGMKEESYANQYFTAGINGYLSKAEPLEAVADAIRTVMSGKKYISSKSQAVLADNYLKKITKKKRYNYTPILTEREKEVASLLIAGKWTKEIADHLDIKLSTVSTHKLHIFEKFDVTTVVELYRKAEIEMPELLKPLDQ